MFFETDIGRSTVIPIRFMEIKTIIVIHDVILVLNVHLCYPHKYGGITHARALCCQPSKKIDK